MFALGDAQHVIAGKMGEPFTGQSGTGDLMNRSCKVREMRRAETTLIIIREKPE